MPSPTPSGCGSTNCRSRPTACSRRWRSAGARAMGMRARQVIAIHDISSVHSRASGNPGPKTGSPLSRGRTDVAWLRAAPRPGHARGDALRGLALVRGTTRADVTRARATPPAGSLRGGGPALVVNTRRGIVAPPVLIDVNHVEELRAIKADARSLEIGAAVKLAELATHPEVTRHYSVVAQAAGFIAGPTHRNMGTVGG